MFGNRSTELAEGVKIVRGRDLERIEDDVDDPREVDEDDLGSLNEGCDLLKPRDDEPPWNEPPLRENVEGIRLRVDEENDRPFADNERAERSCEEIRLPIRLSASSDSQIGAINSVVPRTAAVRAAEDGRRIRG